MKATGIVRRLDDLGRIVIPKELRKNLDINIGDSLEIFVNGNEVVLKKYTDKCTFCGETELTKVHKGKVICSNCIKELKK